jgi:hypothetical protein
MKTRIAALLLFSGWSLSTAISAFADDVVSRVPQITLAHGRTQVRGSFVELASVPKSEDPASASSYRLTYVLYAKGEGQKSEKLISSAVAGQLAAILTSGNNPSTKWQSETTCARSEIWILNIDGVQKKICNNKSEVETLQKFQSSVMILAK